MTAQAAAAAASVVKGAAAAKAAVAKALAQSQVAVLTPDQERILKHAFDLHATDALNHKQLREVLTTMGTDVESEDELKDILAGIGKPGENAWFPRNPRLELDQVVTTV